MSRETLSPEQALSRFEAYRTNDSSTLLYDAFRELADLNTLKGELSSIAFTADMPQSDEADSLVRLRFRAGIPPHPAEFTIISGVEAIIALRQDEKNPNSVFLDSNSISMSTGDPRTRYVKPQLLLGSPQADAVLRTLQRVSSIVGQFQAGSKIATS